MRDRSRRKNKGSSVRRRAIVLPDDACPSCGTMMEDKRRKLSLPVNGEEVAVPRAPHLRCPGCDEVVLRFEDARKLQERAIEIYREKYGLLGADEIRALRGRLGLNQGALAQLLRLGKNTISRWEKGRNVQTSAMDVLLRLIRDVPGALEYLRSHTA